MGDACHCEEKQNAVWLSDIVYVCVRMCRLVYK